MRHIEPTVRHTEPVINANATVMTTAARQKNANTDKAEATCSETDRAMDECTDSDYCRKTE